MILCDGYSYVTCMRVAVYGIETQYPLKDPVPRSALPSLVPTTTDQLLLRLVIRPCDEVAYEAIYITVHILEPRHEARFENAPHRAIAWHRRQSYGCLYLEGSRHKTMTQ